MGLATCWPNIPGEMYLMSGFHNSCFLWKIFKTRGALISTSFDILRKFVFGFCSTCASSVLGVDTDLGHKESKDCLSNESVLCILWCSLTKF